MTTSNSIKRVILCLRTLQFFLPLIELPALALALGYTLTYAWDGGGGLFEDAYVYLPILLVLIGLIMPILFIEYVIRGMNNRKRWSWIAAAIIFLWYVGSSVPFLPTIFSIPFYIANAGDLLMLSSPVKIVIAIIVGVIGIYFLVQKSVRSEFGIDTLLTRFVQKSRENGNET
jgi:hypothetical protein